jgi:hypothetical protein
MTRIVTTAYRPKRPRKRKPVLTARLATVIMLGLGLAVSARADTQAPWTLLVPTEHGLVYYQGFETREACRLEGAALARSRTPKNCTVMACTFVVYCMDKNAAIYGR